MITIKIGFILYHLVIALWLIYFAYHDLKTHRVEPKARLLFLPFALCSLFPNGVYHHSYAKALAGSLIAATSAFLLFLLIGTFLKSKNGALTVGGGDIKLMPYLGFIYGIDLFFAIFIAALLMLGAGLYCRLRRRPAHGAAVPFFTAGCLLCSLIQILTF